jgi:hypothetical protein
MKLALTAPHWLIIAIGLVGTIAPQIGQAFPSVAPVCAQIQSLTPLVLAALGIACGSAIAAKGSQS